jgi:tight adherence protein B
MSALLIPAIFAAFAMLAIFVGILLIVERDDTLEERVAAYTRISPVEQESGAKSRRPSSLAVRLNQAITNLDAAPRMATSLARANLRLTVPEYVLIRVGCVCVCFLIGLMISRQALPGVLLGVIGFFLPGQYLRLRQNKRLKAFQNQLPDVLSLLVSSIRSGYGLLYAMEVVSEELAAPASEEFSRVVQEVGLGLSLQEALGNLLRRIESEDLELIVMAINIQHEVGGNLSTVLETIGETIRERVRILGEIKTLTTTQTLTGYILAGLPFGLALVLFIINPEHMMRLFTPGWTLIIPVGAVTGIIVGFIIIRKIVNIQV